MERQMAHQQKMDSVSRKLRDLQIESVEEESDPNLKAQEGLDPESEGEAAAGRVADVFRRVLLNTPKRRAKPSKMLDAQA